MDWRIIDKTKTVKCSRDDPRTRSLASICCGPEDHKEETIVTLLGMPQQPRRHKVYIIMPYISTWRNSTHTYKLRRRSNHFTKEDKKAAAHPTGTNKPRTTTPTVQSTKSLWAAAIYNTQVPHLQNRRTETLHPCSQSRARTLLQGNLLQVPQLGKRPI